MKCRQAEETAQEIDAEHKKCQSPFRLSMCNIRPGEEIEYCDNPENKWTVVDDKNVSYQRQSYSLSALAQLLTGSKYSLAGSAVSTTIANGRKLFVTGLNNLF